MKGSSKRTHMGGLQPQPTSWPAFDCQNYLGAELSRATTNSPLLRCGKRRSGDGKVHRFGESEAPPPTLPRKREGAGSKCFVERVKTRARQSTPRYGLFFCIYALL